VPTPSTSAPVAFRAFAAAPVLADAARSRNERGRRLG
jgi:hypothetical protein